MVYFTHSRLMRESVSSIEGHAEFGIGAAQRICSQLIASRPRYTGWLSSHDRRMWLVARGSRRERQIIQLRQVATERIHRAALVRHIRDNAITGRQRDLLLKEFFGTLDSQCAAIAEHKSYTRAVSSQLCAMDLLTVCNDRYGIRLIQDYERDYGTFFAMHCDRLLARNDGRPYLLASLLPEARADATRLRARLLSGERLPSARVLLPKQPWGTGSPVADHPFDCEARITFG